MDPEIKKIWNTMNQHFSSSVPNPMNYPECFMYYLKVYKQEMIDRRKHG